MTRIQQLPFKVVMPIAKVQFRLYVRNSTISMFLNCFVLCKLCLHHVVKVAIRLRTSRQGSLRWVIAKLRFLYDSRNAICLYGVSLSIVLSMLLFCMQLKMRLESYARLFQQGLSPLMFGYLRLILLNLRTWGKSIE